MIETLRAAAGHPLYLLAAVLGILVVFVKVTAWWGSRQPVRFVHNPDAASPAGGDTLVVALHAYLGGAGQLRDIVTVVRGVYPGADMLLPVYHSGAFSNSDPYLIADAVEREIHRRHSARRYRRIVLVGYSMGSLMLRKAFLWAQGAGFNEDRFGAALLGRRPWVDSVERIVLIAGTNRGWVTSRKADRHAGEHVNELRLDRRVLFVLGSLLGRLTGTAHLIRAFERGAPFVADLRVQWIRFARQALPDGRVPHRPLVIQLLGTLDDIVSVGDNKDVVASKDFMFIPVSRTGHGSIADADLAAPPESARYERADLFRRALEKSAAALREDPDVEPIAAGESPHVEHAVFVMHGIRDFGGWTRQVADAIRRRGFSVAPVEIAAGQRIAVIPSGYGFFPMGSFLLLGARQRNVRWFMDRYTEVQAQYPHALVSYVGHSNGTYLLASALERYRSVVVNRVLFAGSVVRRSFSWQSYMSGDRPRVNSVRNIVADRDVVVGIFPRLYEWLTEITPLSARGFFDLGSAGFRGFQQQDYNVEYVEGGHGAALDSAGKIEAIADYILSGTDDELRRLARTTRPPAWADYVSRFCWLWWVLLAAVIVWGGMCLVRLGIDYGVSPQWALLLYGVVVLVVLLSV